MSIIQTIITVLMCIIAGLLGLSLAWIVLAPFALARWVWGLPKSDKRFLLSPLIERIFLNERILLFILVILSALSRGSAWYNHPLQVFVWGIAAIIGTYILFFVLLCVVLSLLIPLIMWRDSYYRHLYSLETLNSDSDNETEIEN